MRLNNFSPYEEFTLTTDLRPEEISERFKVNIEPIKDFRFMVFKMSKKLYEGEISDNQFVMNRILRATSYKILIWGHILTQEEQTLIKIKMEYELHVKAMNMALIFVLSGICLLCLTLGIKAGSVILSLAGFGFFLIFYLLKKLSLSFREECNDAKKFLERLFEAKETAI